MVLDEEVENGVDLAALLLPNPPQEAPKPVEVSFGAILLLSGGVDEVVVPPSPNALVDDDDPNAE